MAKKTRLRSAQFSSRDKPEAFGTTRAVGAAGFEKR
jgi:hypothetical protein